MSFNKSASTRTLLVMAIFGLAMSACTKKVPYDDEYKGFTDDGKSEVMNKSILPVGQPMLLNMSVDEVSRKTADGQSYYFGDNKRVELQVSQNAIRVIERERDERYRKPINDQLILEIPIEHVEYECAKDAYGDCTSKEVEKTDIPWTQKSKFRLKAAEVKVGVAEWLPVMGEEYYGGGFKCFTEVSSDLLKYEVTSDAINIRVKRTYRQDPACMTDGDTSSDTSVSVVYHYSMVTTKSVLTADFKTKNYSHEDEGTFGFFSTIRNVRDVDHSDKESAAIRIMNHWSPNRKVIDYHLSDEFAKPENEYLKKLTYEGIDRLNLGLREAGAQFQIKLHDPSGKKPGDIRNSMIVLVEDPQEGGPLGYGPQTEDPVTGEIISARTIMFTAGFEQMTRMVYEEVGRILKESKDEAEAAKQTAQTEAPKAEDKKEEAPAATTTTRANISRIKLSKDLERMAQWGRYQTGAIKSKVKKAAMSSVSRPAAQKSALQKRASVSGDMMKTIKKMKTGRMKTNPEFVRGDLASYLKYLREAKNCSMTGEFGDIKKMRPDLAKEIATTYSNGAGGLLAWEKLSSDQRKSIVKTILAEVWIPVLLHEMGHNMGLRHNFKGSEDKENYFSKSELAAKNINYDIPYSTVMEYGDDLHALTYLGKYDIAALRYAYTGQVEVQEKSAGGQVVKTEIRDLNQIQCNVGTGLDCLLKEIETKNSANAEWSATDDEKAGVRLRPYGFCTDEHVGPNAGCRRFDEGETLSEIADYLIKSYHENYDRRNRRNDRVNFSSWEDYLSLRGKYARMQELRSFMENYEGMKHMFNLSDDSEEFKNIEWLKDVKQSALKSVNFFIEILQTPELSCLIARKDNPQEIVEIVPISTFGGQGNDLSCFEADLNPAYVAVAQAGKLFNSTKGPNSNNPYVDQIDVRGFYLDKIAAARALFLRKMDGILSTQNDYLDNAWDIADVRDNVTSVAAGLILNAMTLNHKVEFPDGSTQMFEFRADYHAGHLIKQPLHEFVAKQMGIRNTIQYFSEILGNEIVREATLNADNRMLGEELKNLFSVRLYSELEPTQSDGFLTLQIGDGRTAYAKLSNIVAVELFANVQIQRALSAAFSDFRTPLNDDEKAKAEKGETWIRKRTAFKELLDDLQKRVTPATAVQPAVIVDITMEDLQKITSLTQDEREQILAFAKTFGTDGLSLKVNQLWAGEIMSEEDLLKIISYMPRL